MFKVSISSVIPPNYQFAIRELPFPVFRDLMKASLQFFLIFPVIEPKFSRFSILGKETGCLLSARLALRNRKCLERGFRSVLYHKGNCIAHATYHKQYNDQ